MHWSETANETNFSQSSATDWMSINGSSAIVIMDISSSEEKLITPLLDVDGSTNLEFDCWDGNGSYGFGNGQLQVQYSADGTTWTDLGAAYELNTGQVDHYTIDLSSLSGQYYFALNFTSTFDYSGFASVIAVDDVTGPAVIVHNDVDLGVFAVSPAMIQHGETINPVVYVGNAGGLDQSTFTITLTINDGTSEVYTSVLDVNTTLSSLDLVAFTMTDAFTPADGDYTYTATVIVNNEEVPADNSVTGVMTAGYAIFSGDITTCSGDFFDENGPHADYFNSTSYTMTVYPDAANNMMSVHFTEYSIEEDWDYLFIYDGVDVDAPELAVLTGAGTDETYTASNATGALTFVFVSDAGVTDAGWVAEFMCTPTYTVTFHVYDYDASTDIENAQVDITDGHSGVTDATGLVSFDLAEGSIAEYWVYADGYITSMGTYTVTADITIEMPMFAEPTYSVTFNVDMTAPIATGNFEVGTDVVYLTGSMNGWEEPGTNPAMEMFDSNMDGVYSITLSLNDGDYEYKYFKNAGWDGGEWDGGDNRMMTVAGSDMSLDNVWAMEYLVSFYVTDGTDAIEGATVNVNGMDYMTDVNGMAYFAGVDGTYSYTVTMADFNDVNSDVVIASDHQQVDVTLTPAAINDIFANVTISPNPTNGLVKISADDIYNVQIIDINGKVVSTSTMTSNNITIDVSNYEAGVYFVKLSNDNANATYKIIKK